MARYAEKEAPLLERIIMQEGLERTKAEDWARDEITRLREGLYGANAEIDQFSGILADYKNAAASEAERANELNAENIALREENARLLKENSELLFRAHALLWLLPPETTCGELRKARDEMLAATIREGDKG